MNGGEEDEGDKRGPETEGNNDPITDDGERSQLLS